MVPHCNFSLPRAPNSSVSNELRILMQMKLYQNNDLFIYFENKLHTLEYLDYAGIPHASVRYGAFYHEVANSRFRVVNASALESAMRDLPFVFKPITDGMMHGVIVATAPHDLDKIRKIVQRKPPSRWGQRDAHNGFLISEVMPANTTEVG